jgi:mRNA guanylyltransferase
MPINFARRHFRTVRQHPYWVSEKTDGVRFMLFVSRAEALVSSSSAANSDPSQHSPSVYMIDRSNNFFKVPTLQSFASCVSSHNDTLLDGELVKRHASNEYYFLIFDIIALDGQRMWNLPFGERLSSIASVVSQFQLYLAPSHDQNLPFAILAKEIVPTTHFNDVKTRIHTDASGESVYRSSLLCHLTDGLIFMPDGIYPLFTCQSMFKWKFTDRQTIDFEIVLSSAKTPNYAPSMRPSHTLHSSDPWNTGNTSVELHIGGNGGSSVFIKAATLPPQDFERLRNDVAMSQRPNLVVAEMGFEPKTGQWRYHKLRPDKDRPNYVSIAMDTMESIAENITLDEVQLELGH